MYGRPRRRFDESGFAQPLQMVHDRARGEIERRRKLFDRHALSLGQETDDAQPGRVR